MENLCRGYGKKKAMDSRGFGLCRGYGKPEWKMAAQKDAAAFGGRRSR